MADKFTEEAWKLAHDNPELQKIVAGYINKDSEGYAIPTRRYSELTGEAETVEVTAQELEDEDLKARINKALPLCSRLTVLDLAKLLGTLRVDLLLKEVKGEKLTREEETLKDIDILSLVLFTVVESVYYHGEDWYSPAEH